MSTTPKYPRIAILGAGPAGLTLGSIFTKSSIPYTIFDLRPSPTCFSDPTKPSPWSPAVPSGSLDLHQESGVLALKACGLYEKFMSVPSECSEETIIADRHGAQRFHDDGHGGDRPEIARNALTDLLLSSVPEGHIKWEHKVLSVVPSASSTEDGKQNTTTSPAYTVHFTTPLTSGEQQEEFDIVLGADGAWSRVRPLLTDTKPHFSTISCVTLTIPHLTTTHPTLSALIGGGSYYAFGEHKGIMIQRGCLGSARIYLMIQSQTDSYLQDAGIDKLVSSPSDLKRALADEESLFANWGSELKDLIAAGCDAAISSPAIASITAKPLYMLPVGHTWSHRHNITLVGDAAHVWTPFAGEGVNAAMHDALELAEQLIPALQSSRDPDEAIKAYEGTMFPRTAGIAQETWDNLCAIFDDDNAPDGFVTMMQSYGPPPE